MALSCSDSIIARCHSFVQLPPLGSQQCRRSSSDLSNLLDELTGIRSCSTALNQVRGPQSDRFFACAAISQIHRHCTPIFRKASGRCRRKELREWAAWKGKRGILLGEKLGSGTASAGAIRAAGDEEGLGPKVNRDDELAAQFARFVNESMQASATPVRRPTALLPPTAVIRAQMEALQRNDYPDVNAGIKVAFDFSKPQGVEEYQMGKGQPVVKACRTWEASERYLSPEGFELMMRQPMYSPIINCSSWEISSPLRFHGRGDNRAVQAVKITNTVHVEGKEPCERTYCYTFCMERIETGAYKGCWLTVGLRQGDYTTEPPEDASKQVT